jgi:26S proteasome regulatory subunit T1
VLKTYGAAPYGAELRKLEKEIKDKQQTINEKIGVKVATLVALLPRHNS